MLSVIIPVLNEATQIAEVLTALEPLRIRGCEIIIVDGGSHDGTSGLAQPFADLVLAAPRGRGAQMNVGAAAARGEVLMFLHADTRLPDNADLLIAEGLARTRRCWGRFDVKIAGRPWLLRIVASGMNMRSRATGIATGDQAMFVTRAAFAQAGGFLDIPIMEDIALSRQLKKLSAPLCLPQKVITSGRRWEKHGVARTIITMWILRAAYWRGADPAALARRYGYVPRTGSGVESERQPPLK